jgi:hypothetical protein
VFRRILGRCLGSAWRDPLSTVPVLHLLAHPLPKALQTALGAVAMATSRLGLRPVVLLQLKAVPPSFLRVSLQAVLQSVSRLDLACSNAGHSMSTSCGFEGAFNVIAVKHHDEALLILTTSAG